MKYRKKPVVIEAYLPYDGKMPPWFENALISRTVRERVSGGFDVDTLEGTMYANPGDYIIRGVKGEIYPCKPDIFEATYEPVEPGTVSKTESVGQGPEPGGEVEE